MSATNFSLFDEVTTPAYQSSEKNMSRNLFNLVHRFPRLLRHSSHPCGLRSFSVQGKSWRSQKNTIIPVITIGTVVIIGYNLKNRRTFAQVQSEQIGSSFEPGSERSDLRFFSAEEVSKHSSAASGIWVSYKNGVYDITKFVEEHPGGDKILMAAGGQLEPFWDLFAVHKQKDVFDTLEKYRIGNLSPEDRETRKGVDHWSNEPRRHPVLLVRSKQPFNAEPPAELLVENFITPK